MTTVAAATSSGLGAPELAQVLLTYVCVWKANNRWMPTELQVHFGKMECVAWTGALVAAVACVALMSWSPPERFTSVRDNHRSQFGPGGAGRSSRCGDLAVWMMIGSVFCTAVVRRRFGKLVNRYLFGRRVQIVVAATALLGLGIRWLACEPDVGDSGVAGPSMDWVDAAEASAVLSRILLAVTGGSEAAFAWASCSQQA